MFIGGGALVFKATVQSIVARSIPAQSLTSFYLHSSAILLVANLLGAALGIQLMTITPWIPVALGLLCQAASIPILVSYDQDLSPSTLPSSPHEEAIEEATAAVNPEVSGLQVSWASEGLKLRKRGMQLLSSLRANPFPLIVITLHSWGDSFRLIKSAWLSARYSWPLHYVGSIELYEGIFTAIMLVALPWLCKRFFRHLGDSEVPLNLMKLSLVASIIGTTVLGFSFNGTLALVGLTILTFGAGFHDGLMAFLGSGMKSREDVSQVFLCIYIVCTSLKLCLQWAGYR
jgi:hypothetical protein